MHLRPRAWYAVPTGVIEIEFLDQMSLTLAPTCAVT